MFVAHDTITLHAPPRLVADVLARLDLLPRWSESVQLDGDPVELTGDAHDGSAAHPTGGWVGGIRYHLPGDGAPHLAFVLRIAPAEPVGPDASSFVVRYTGTGDAATGTVIFSVDPAPARGPSGLDGSASTLGIHVELEAAPTAAGGIGRAFYRSSVQRATEALACLRDLMEDGQLP